jgi:hypothetical protein
LLANTILETDQKHYGDLFLQRIKKQTSNINANPQSQIQGYSDEYIITNTATNLRSQTLTI